MTGLFTKETALEMAAKALSDSYDAEKLSAPFIARALVKRQIAYAEEGAKEHVHCSRCYPFEQRSIAFLRAVLAELEAN